MAIYRLELKAISRSTGQSIVAAAAYRSGTKLEDRLTGNQCDYTRRGGVVHSEIVAPSHVKVAINREDLWNQAEKVERRKDARTGREWVVALPHELRPNSRLKLTREFAALLTDRYGVAIDFAIHAPSRQGDQRNYHAHILQTTRKIDTLGNLTSKSDLELSDTDRRKKGLSSGREELKSIREMWEYLCNCYLEDQQIAARVDHRSNKDQGIQLIPQRKLGKNATALERKGISTDIGSQNQEIFNINQEILRIQKEYLEKESSINKLKRLIKKKGTLISQVHLADQAQRRAQERPDLEL